MGALFPWFDRIVQACAMLEQRAFTPSVRIGGGAATIVNSAEARFGKLAEAITDCRGRLHGPMAPSAWVSNVAHRILLSLRGALLHDVGINEVLPFALPISPGGIKLDPISAIARLLGTLEVALIWSRTLEKRRAYGAGLPKIAGATH
ncbi:hypothetical protein ACVIGB_008116 [Bradyrhizobium sp. USDA 4341]